MLWKNLRKALEKEEGQNVKKTGQNSKVWKGRKIVSEKEWKKIVNSNSYLFLKHLPDVFLTTPVLKLLDYSKISKEEIEDWATDYYEYLEHSKNPQYAKNVLCRDCILNPEAEIDDSFRNVILKVIFGKLSLGEDVPCDVVNFFECPYEKESDKDLLLLAGKAAETAYRALDYAYRITKESETLYDIDFQNNRAGHYLYPNLTIEVEITKLRIPRIPLRGLAGIYGILTDKTLLGILIDQYIESLEDRNYLYVCHTTEDDPEKIKRMKDRIIRFLMVLMKHVKIEEHRDRFGRAFLHEFEDNIDTGLNTKTVLQKCALCDNQASIHCMNCDIWICISDWRRHGEGQHNYVEKSLFGKDSQCGIFKIK